jgi:hypothetical protein
MLHLSNVEIAADNIQEDGSVELCIEANGPEGFLICKAYFADRGSADRFIAEVASVTSAPTE